MPDPADTQAGPIATPIESAAELMRDECQDRLWLRALVPILQMRASESATDDDCQLAYTLMYRAACDRVCRILRSDLDR